MLFFRTFKERLRGFLRVFVLFVVYFHFLVIDYDLLDERTHELFCSLRFCALKLLYDLFLRQTLPFFKGTQRQIHFDLLKPYFEFCHALLRRIIEDVLLDGLHDIIERPLRRDGFFFKNVSDAVVLIPCFMDPHDLIGYTTDDFGGGECLLGDVYGKLFKLFLWQDCFVTGAFPLALHALIVVRDTPVLRGSRITLKVGAAQSADILSFEQKLHADASFALFIAAQNLLRIVV